MMIEPMQVAYASSGRAATAITVGHFMKPYYTRYDDHYSSLYEQGIEFWSSGPDKNNEESVIAEIGNLPIDTNCATVLDVGCGEGHLAESITKLGLNYTGIDVSPTAIEKAKKRTQNLTPVPEFKVVDVVVGNDDVFRNKYDIVIDQACYHMIVVDEDSQRYLSNIKRLLHKNSFYLMLQQALCDTPCNASVNSIQQYEEVFQHDLNQMKTWEAWDKNKWKKVELPSFACRRRTQPEYIREIERARLSVSESRILPNKQMLNLIVTK